MNEIGKNEGQKSVKHLPFLILKKVGIYDDRERRNGFAEYCQGVSMTAQQKRY